jgi:hypothetical protein
MVSVAVVLYVDVTTVWFKADKGWSLVYSPIRISGSYVLFRQVLGIFMKNHEESIYSLDSTASPP